ncbi:hypothetical protein [Flavobacterium taihuense]|uniref:Lipoprotein n=1 Tax=Flavobacterium taihuense TaxID=2857508 RepID=A0ABS6Y194_9FLAO|nr:hypothetical protein [Flavobacterium taihuense]MBW4362695.1 hypothetical protein [Flavobacterium taihuense]
MKSKLIFSMILFSMLILACKSDKKNEIKKTVISFEKKNETVKTNMFGTVNNVSIIFYEPNDKAEHFTTENDCVLNIEKNNFYLKYTNHISQNLSRSDMKDSLLLNENERIYVNTFFLIKNSELKKTYWDSISEGRVRRIYFLNHNKAIVKNVNIIGEPANINYLKESCDFLLEKVKGKSR